MGIDALGGGAEAKRLLKYVRPMEGFTLWTDTLVIPVGNNSRYGAHLWMDYLLDPKVMGKNTSYVWYMAPSKASHKYTDPFALTLLPTKEELARSEIMDDVGEFAQQYSEAWRQVKSIACFGRMISSPHRSRHPALPERQTAVVWRRLARLEQGHATCFQMPAQGGHQHGIHRATAADRDFRPFFPVDRN